MTSLDTSEVAYTLNFGIARGLDYYTGMVFEGFAQNLGAENQILGGGAYRLAHLLGGDDVASCGFAIGFDRVMVSLGEIHREQRNHCRNCLHSRREEPGISKSRVHSGLQGSGPRWIFMERGLGAQIAHASKTADFVVVIGNREAESGTVTLKNLGTGEQKTMDLASAIAEVEAHGAR